jgi:hypothetical protein
MRHHPLLAIACLLVLAACSTDRVAIDYSTPPPASVEAKPMVRVGAFTDDRNEDVHWLGAVRGGYGQPLKRLETSEPMSAVIAKAFAAGLAARGRLSEAADAPYALTGSVVKFDSSQYVNREAHGVVVLTLKENSTGRIKLSQTFRRDVVHDNPNLFDAGIFASVENLRVVAVDALNQLVDQALDSDAFKSAMAAPATAKAP